MKKKTFVFLVVALVLKSIELKHSNEKDHVENTLSHSILLPCLSNLHWIKMFFASGQIIKFKVY